MQPATPSTNSVSHADGRCPMPVDSSQGVALPMAKESLCCLIVLPSVLPPGGRIKDFSVQWIVGNDSGSAGHDHPPPTRLDLNPNPRAPRPADPPPRLWSAPPERPARACAAAPSVSPWPAAAARVLPPPPTALPPDAAHSLPPTPGRTVAAACPPGAPGPRRGAPAPPARSPAHLAGAVACHAGHPATAPRPLDAFAPSAAPGGRTGPPGYSATCQ